MPWLGGLCPLLPEKPDQLDCLKINPRCFNTTCNSSTQKNGLVKIYDGDTKTPEEYVLGSACRVSPFVRLLRALHTIPLAIYQVRYDLLRAGSAQKYLTAASPRPCASANAARKRISDIQCCPYLLSTSCKSGVQLGEYSSLVCYRAKQRGHKRHVN
jgi:hypothetical protein